MKKMLPFLGDFIIMLIIGVCIDIWRGKVTAGYLIFDFLWAVSWAYVLFRWKHRKSTT